jgi:hypothetical protein
VERRLIAALRTVAARRASPRPGSGAPHLGARASDDGATALLAAVARWGIGGALAAGCADAGAPVERGGGALAITSAPGDFSTGLLEVGEEAAGGATRRFATVHSDAVVRGIDAGWLVVNRLLMDAVRLYAPDDPVPRWEVSVGPGTNPHDAALCGGRLWVTRYEHRALVEIDPVSGELVGELDLGAWADDDGVPEMSDAIVAGDRLAVGLQRLRRLDGWRAEPAGAVAVIDCATGEVSAVHEVGPNPVVRAWSADEVMVVAEDGVSFLDLDGGGLDGPWWAGEAGERPVDGAAAGDGRAVLITRREVEHAVVCVARGVAGQAEGWRGDRFLSSVVAAGGVGWVAARPSWEDAAGDGEVQRYAAADCTPDGVIRTELPPFSVAHRVDESAERE